MRQIHLPDGYSLATRGRAFVFVYLDDDGRGRMSEPMPLDRIERAAREHAEARPQRRRTE